MSDIRIERAHALGLDQARRAAGEWMGEARERWGLQFQHHADDEAAPAVVDRIRFSGMGAEGEVLVSGDRFIVEMMLGGLLSALAPMIEARMARKLDEILGLGASEAGG